MLHYKSNKKPAAAVAVLLGFVFALPASADEQVWWQDRFTLRAGAFFPEVNTSVRLDSSGGQIGTTIDFEDTLGLDDSDTLAWADSWVYLASRWRLQFTYFDLERDSSDVRANIEIRFGDLVFPIGAQLETEFDTEIFRVAGGYSFVKDEKKEIGVIAGLHITDVTASINNPIIGFEEGDTTAPLPTFGLHGSHAIGSRWLLYGEAGIFRIEFEDFKGALNAAVLGVEHRTFEHVGFGLGFQYFELDVESDDDDFDGKIDFDYFGPTVFITARF